MSAIRPCRITVAAGDSRTTVDVLLDSQEEQAVRRVAVAILNAAGDDAECPRMYIERRFTGVRASGGGAHTCHDGCPCQQASR